MHLENMTFQNGVADKSFDVFIKKALIYLRKKYLVPGPVHGLG